MKRRDFLWNGLFFLTAIHQLAEAATVKKKSSWSNLSAEKKDLVRERWARFQALSPEQQVHLREVYARFMKLPKARRTRLLAGLARWQGLSFETQDRLRAEYQSWKTLGPRGRHDLPNSFIHKKSK